jgi:uncharacterized membrane protein/mono/diheme cytochrome c family protein
MEFLTFIGRLHPLVLHLPIGILGLAFLMEWLSKREKYQSLQAAVGFSLWAGMWSAILAAATGYLLSREGGYEANTLIRHQWLGIATAVSAVVVFFLQKNKNKAALRKAYLPAFGFLMILLAISGHLGGSLTHGHNFLSAAFSADEDTPRTIANIDSAIIYQDLIQPIFKQKCIGCHNESKTKGGLLMATMEGLQKGGETGAFFIAGDVEQSLFLQRVHLPDDDDEHMPPKGKAQLTADEIALMEWWVSEGAHFDARAGASPQSEKIRNILKRYSRTEQGVFALDIKDPGEKKIQNIRQAGITIERVAQGRPFVKASLRGVDSLSENSLKKLRPVAKQLIELDLSHSNFSSELLPYLSKFPHLHKLSLQHTQITAQHLDVLKKLKYLTYLNIYNTPLDDHAIATLAQLASLQKLYLWQTAISPQAIEQLQKALPQLNINTGVEAAFYDNAALNPPIIVTAQDIFTDTVEVAFTINLKGVDIFYTLDGTPPDSTSIKYSSPISVTQTSDIQVIAKKEGWITSPPAHKSVIKVGYQAVDVRLEQAPDGRYKAGGASSLVDFKKGTTDFAAGAWLGYEKSHMIATLDLGKTEEVSKVIVSALEATASYIFFPRQLKVSLSENGHNFKAVATKDIPTTDKPEPPMVKNFILNVDPQKARYIRVEVSSNLVNPAWHPAPGAPCWIFVDEILVE